MPTECPKCNSTSISAGNFEFDGDSGYQSVVCDDCEFVWMEIWECTGWYEQDIPDITYDPDHKLEVEK